MRESWVIVRAMTRRSLVWISALALFAACKTDGPLPSWAGGTGAATPTAEGGGGSAPPPAPEGGGGGTAAPTPPPEEKKPEGGGETKPAAGGADSVGVPECDQLISDYKTCMDGLPEAQKTAMAEGYKSLVDGFKQAASVEGGKEHMGPACKEAAESMKQTFEAIGCKVTGGGGGEAAGGGGGSFGGGGGGGGSSAFAETGVPECDSFLKKYETCVNTKLPEASRKQMIDAMAQNTASWKDLAKTDSGKKALAQGCTQADEQSKAGMTQFGCEW
jgi:hypothetical protein